MTFRIEHPATVHQHHVVQPSSGMTTNCHSGYHHRFCALHKAFYRCVLLAESLLEPVTMDGKRLLFILAHLLDDLEVPLENLVGVVSVVVVTGLLHHFQVHQLYRLTSADSVSVILVTSKSNVLRWENMQHL